MQTFQIFPSLPQFHVYILNGIFHQFRIITDAFTVGKQHREVVAVNLLKRLHITFFKGDPKFRIVRMGQAFRQGLLVLTFEYTA